MPIYTESLILVRQRRTPISIDRRDFEISAGDDFRVAVTVYDTEADDTPLDISAMTMYLRLFYGAPDYNYQYLTPAVGITGDYQGDGVMWFDFAGTPTLDAGSGRYGAMFILADEDGSAVIAKGIMNIYPGASPASVDP